VASAGVDAGRAAWWLVEVLFKGQEVFEAVAEFGEGGADTDWVITVESDVRGGLGMVGVIGGEYEGEFHKETLRPWSGGGFCFVRWRIG